MSNTTNIVGYYNGERWPVQLHVSKFNVTLTLKAGEYVLDRAGRKVNDPFFECFVENKQLRRETSDTPVPLMVLQPAANAAPSPQTNPVRAVTQWTRDGRGVRQPVLTQPPPPEQLPAAVLASASNSVRPMTMDEARRAGLVRKVREVPEDYGVNDTTGLPPANIPRMKVAIDPSMNKVATPLPREMLTLPADDPNRQVRSQLVAGLAQGSKAPPADATTHPFANAGVVNNSQIVAGTPVAQPVMESQNTPEDEFAGEPETELEQPPTAPAVALPEPDLAELREMEAAEPVQTEPPPQPKLTQPKPPLKPMTPKNQFVCMACGAPHKFRSQLLNHAKLKHADRVNAIMASYPPDASPQPAG